MQTDRQTHICEKTEISHSRHIHYQPTSSFSRHHKSCSVVGPILIHPKSLVIIHTICIFSGRAIAFIDARLDSILFHTWMGTTEPLNPQRMCVFYIYILHINVYILSHMLYRVSVRVCAALSFIS